jgi:hypothetical protein
LDFGLPAATTAMATALEFPDFGQFAPTLQPIPGLFSATPPSALLMRTVLDGGTLEASPEGSSWGFDKELHPTGAPYGGQFASFCTWKRQVDAECLTIKLAPFDGAAPVEIELQPQSTPTGDAIMLKIVNLCAENPLEWNDLDQRLVKGDDVDFKWLYRLLQPSGATYANLLRGGQFPVPERRGKQAFGALQDCMGGRISSAFDTA